jgi:hypothetical protein
LGNKCVRVSVERKKGDGGGARKVRKRAERMRRKVKEEREWKEKKGIVAGPVRLEKEPSACGGR